MNYVKLQCNYCGEEFQTLYKERNKRKFCNHFCFIESRKKKRLVKQCEWCGTTITQGHREGKTYFLKKRKTCSNECRSKLHGKEKTGKHHITEAGKKSISEKNSMENNGMWKDGGHTQTIYKRYMKKHGLGSMDGEECKWCGTTVAMQFDLHHIIYRSEAPNHEHLHNPDNLIWVCRSCHNMLHRTAKNERVALIIERKLDKLFPELPLQYEIDKYMESKPF